MRYSRCHGSVPIFLSFSFILLHFYSCSFSPYVMMKSGEVRVQGVGDCLRGIGVKDFVWSASFNLKFQFPYLNLRLRLVKRHFLSASIILARMHLSLMILHHEWTVMLEVAGWNLAQVGWPLKWATHNIDKYNICKFGYSSARQGILQSISA